MGRDAGFIALRSGIASGAEAILIPEVHRQVDNLKEHLHKDFKRTKSSNIIIVAEGDEEGGAFAIADRVKEDFKDYDVRVSVLGHIQRGGTPSAFERVSASKLRYAAVEALVDDQKSIMVGFHNSELDHIPFSKVIKLKKKVDPESMQMVEILSV
jgi:6-phosphofructokinase 1